MKKLLIASLFILSYAFDADAQKNFLYGTSYSKETDTLINTTTEYLTTASNALNTASPYGGYDIQVVLYSIASSSVTVTAVLESSIDGINYTNHFKTYGTNGQGCDTMTFGTLVTATTYTHIWTVLSSANNPDPMSYTQSIVAGAPRKSNSGRRLYFRVKLIPTGTGTTRYSGQMIVQN